MEWFTKDVEAARQPLQALTEGTAAFLDSTRQNYLTALSMFYEKAKNALTVLVGTVAAVLAVVGYSGQVNQPFSIYALACGLTMLAASCLTGLSIPIIFSQYRLYVSLLFYSAQLHKAAGLDQQFWFEMVGRMVEKAPDRETAISAYLKHRYSTFRWYRYILIGGAVSYGVVGFALVIYGLR